MKLRRFLSCMMALLLVCSLPLAAFAEEYDLANGSITVTANGDGQFVTQENGVQNYKETSDTVIKQTVSETSTTNTVTINADAGATANVTLKDVNIDTSSTGGAAVEIKGNGNVTIELDGTNTVQGGAFRAGVEKNTIAATGTDPGNGNGKLTITDKNETHGSLNSTGGYHGAGIGGGSDGAGSNITGNAEITAKGGENSSGIGGGYKGTGSNITISGSAQVDATGHNFGAGIGGGESGTGSDITITDNAVVIASSKSRGAGIGGGSGGAGSNITITGSAQVDATGGLNGAGIGGGNNGSSSDIKVDGSAEVTATGGDNGAGIGSGAWAQEASKNITISGNAEVTAKGGVSGAGIGGGQKSTSANITVSEDAQVKAQGGNSVGYWSAGAAIGNGGTLDDNSASEVAPNTDALNEGWIAKYAPGVDMDDIAPESVTYKGENGVTTSKNVTLVPEKAPTCIEEGHTAGFQCGDDQVGVETLQTIDHSYGDYTSDNNATCTSDGTKSRKCIWCQELDPTTVPDPGTMLEHEFVNYVPDADNRATCTQNGTKTATCENCSATKTILDPAKNHSFTNYVSNPDAKCGIDGTKTAKCDNNCGEEDTIPDVGSALTHSFTNYVSDGKATCTQDGSKIAQCDHGCGATDTKPDVGTALGHSFTHYVSNNDATYLKDGTKTAKCDHPGCDATDTITDPGTRLPAPAFQLRGQDGNVLNGRTEQKNGVLTVTVDADVASLTGYLGGLQTLSAQGIDTIVFVTNGVTSTFALADLMASMTAGDSYTLTHDGSTVTFTLATGTDISSILK